MSTVKGILFSIIIILTNSFADAEDLVREPNGFSIRQLDQLKLVGLVAKSDDSTLRGAGGVLSLAKSPFRIVGFGVPAGMLSFSFESLSLKDWDALHQLPSGSYEADKTQVVFLQGGVTLKQRGGFEKPRSARWQQQPAAATVILDTNGNLLLTISFVGRGRWTSRFYQVEIPVARKTATTARVARLQSAPSFALMSKKCSLDFSTAGLSYPAIVPLKAQGSSLQLKMAVDCDAECKARLGSTANAKIAGFVNSINVIYKRQLGLTLKIVKQRTSAPNVYPSAITDPMALLAKFHSYRNQLGKADVKHLVTGKDLDGNAIGLGYSGCCYPNTKSRSCSLEEFQAGTLCYCSEYNQALSQQFNVVFTPVIMAHEIGHNAGASHDPVGQGVMGAVLGDNPPNGFSSYSIEEISSFFSSFGDMCIMAPAKKPGVSRCSKYIKLVAVSSAARGGSVVYKSNWSLPDNREMSVAEGNNVQKGGAFLVHYRSALASSKVSIELRDAKCNLIGRAGRQPRCSPLGCGEYERWYLRTVGGSGFAIPALARAAKKKGGSESVFFELRNGRWAKIENVWSNREQW